MAVVFDSLDHAPEDRAELARTVFQEQSAPAAVSFIGSPRMAAVMEAWKLGDVSLFCASMTGNRLRRSVGDVRRGPAGFIGIAVQTFGVARFEQFGRQSVIRPGELMLVDLDAPYDFGWTGWGRSRCLHVPTGALGLSAEQIRSAAAHVRTSPLHSIARRHVNDLCIGRDTEVPADAVRSLGTSSLALIHSLLTSAASADDASVRAPDIVMRRAAEVVTSRISDPTLTVAELAAGLGLSEPDLVQITARAGVDLPRWIEATRLSRARETLAGSANPPDADLARRHGFRDIMSFDAAFTDAYGLAPRAWWEIRHEG